MYDADMRKIFKPYLTEHLADNGIIIEEFPVYYGFVRVDIAMIDSKLHGYEIKSDNDSFARLPRQIMYYGKVFNTMSLVCTRKWVKKAIKTIPDWWGIIVVSDDGIRQEREENLNPDISLLGVIELTWKHEAINILDNHHLARGWRGKTCYDIYQRILKVVPENQIEPEVIDQIRRRGNWRGNETFQSKQCNMA